MTVPIALRPFHGRQKHRRRHRCLSCGSRSQRLRSSRRSELIVVELTRWTSRVDFGLRTVEPASGSAPVRSVGADATGLAFSAVTSAMYGRLKARTQTRLVIDCDPAANVIPSRKWSRPYGSGCLRLRQRERHIAGSAQIASPCPSAAVPSHFRIPLGLNAKTLVLRGFFIVLRSARAVALTNLSQTFRLRVFRRPTRRLRRGRGRRPSSGPP